MEIRNLTPYPVEPAALHGIDGRETLVIVLKVTRRLGSGGAHPSAEPVHLTDVRAESGAVRVPADVAPAKRGTDVVCLGHVYAPPGGPRGSCEASLRVGDLVAELRAFGARTWRREGERLRISEPQPFERVPLGWERAFGGRGFASNAVGLGFVRDASQADGAELPQLERPGALIRSPEDRPEPLCFGAVPADWPQRWRFAGTYDDRWRRTRAPLLPADLDLRFFDAAQLTTARPLRGGEPLTLTNLTPGGGLVRVEVPRVHVRVRVGHREVRPALDRLVLEPDADRIALTFRVSVDMTGREGRPPSVRILEKRLVPLGA